MNRPVDAVPSLFEILAAMPDPRSRQGQYHPLSAMLGLVVLGLLMGRTSLAGIFRLGRQFGPPLAWALGFRRGKTPSLSTYSRTLARLDAAALEALLTQWIKARAPAGSFDQIILDGKTLRGSRDGEVPGVHLVAAFAPQVAATLAQIRVDAKTNEHKAALALLGLLPLAGTVVMGDAMFCQRDVAAAVIAGHGDYLLFVKDNQPGLKADIQSGLAFEAQARRQPAAFSP